MAGQRRSSATSALDLAVLGMLAQSPMHGYQVRTRLTETLGTVRSYSYGSLYPALRRLERAGHIAVQDPPPAPDPAAVPARGTAPGGAQATAPGTEPDTEPDTAPNTEAGTVPATAAHAVRRTRVTYRITPSGRQLLDRMLTDAGPSSWTDEGFGVRLSLFPRTAVDVRLRIIRGRCRRLEQQRDRLLAAMARPGARSTDDTAALHRLGVQAHDRELLWLRSLIAREEHLAASITT